MEDKKYKPNQTKKPQQQQKINTLLVKGKIIGFAIPSGAGFLPLTKHLIEAPASGWARAPRDAAARSPCFPQRRCNP